MTESPMRPSPVRGAAPAWVWTLSVLAVAGLSTVGYLLMWIFSAVSCHGTGQGYHGCEAFECVFGDGLTALEVLVIGPLLIETAIWARWRRGRLRRALTVVALGWLAVGRFLLFSGLAGITVRHCFGL